MIYLIYLDIRSNYQWSIEWLWRLSSSRLRNFK